ncbi:MAG: DUF533 domain-containing protein [Acidobacteria bacterium]|nr:DUF533 domain-containing protein [Acidobacteriota bacterium]
MGLLDRLISDLIQDSTGYNPRRVVRRIGGGKLLMAGGAALAGALLMEKMGSKGPAASQPAATPLAALPPLPPLPSTPTPVAAAGPPNLPPLPPMPESPPDSQDERQIPPDLEYAIVRTLVAAALADGHLGEDEKALILRRIDEASLPEERTRQLHKDLVLPPTPSELAALSSNPEERETLYSFASLMTRTDGEVVEREAAWLAGLAQTLEIPPERARELADLATGA